MSAHRAGAVLAALGLMAFAPTLLGAATVFDASPERHALVVVDVRVRQKNPMASAEAEIRGGALRSTPTMEYPSGRQHPGTPLAGVLAFTIEPGRYRAGSVTARAQKLQVGTGTVDLRISLPTDSLPDLERVVEAGTVIYLGRVDVLIVPRPFKENDYRFSFAYDRDRERAVWEKLMAKGSTGAWDHAIRARLVALSTTTLASPSPSPALADSAR